jgi:hypothetical protein
MLRVIVAVLALAFGAGAAFAFHCPADMAKIDAAMKTANLSAADKTNVEKYRKDGEALHKAGQHQQSVDTLAKAMAILKIK